MALFEDVIKTGNIATGLAIGVGLWLVGPVLRPALRPATKYLLKAGIAAYDQARLALAEASEQAGDMLAEARAETGRELVPANGQRKSSGARQARRGGRRRQSATSEEAVGERGH